ncbi:MAG: VWA domain-containing protein [Oligoflexia bacterium]|nr:VWA domain-containing protein [Oligoflexia bacterium]
MMKGITSLLLNFGKPIRSGFHRSSCVTSSAVRSLGIAIFSAAVLIVGSLSAEQRELKADNIEKVDAVLLLDASGSMRVTDPKRLRDEGAKLFIQFLKPGDRLSIVAFDNEARVIRPLSPYEREQTASINQQLSQVGDSGEYTDILSGVRAAKDILEKEAREDANSVIVLLSDGKMDPNPAVGSSPLLTADLMNNYVPELKAKGIKIHTLAFSDQADRELLQQIALSTEGSHWFTPDADKVHESYADLFLVVKKPQMLPLTSKGFRLDGNVEEATFYINREDGGDLQLRSPSGKTLDSINHPAEVKWFKGQKFDVVTIVKPEVGDWQVQGLISTEGFATLLTNLKLVTDWPATVNVGSPQLLQARLYESEKPVILPEMAGSTRFAFQIIPTDRVSEPVLRETLYDDGTHGDKIPRDGIFSYLVDLRDPGEYKLQVVSNAPTFERRQQISFRLKPRVISLSVSGGQDSKSDHAAAEGESDAHAGHGEEGQTGHGEGQAKGEETPVTGQVFLIELSPDVSAYKNIEVKVVAIDKNKKRFSVPVGSGGDALTYRAAASALPHDGIYEVQAFLSAEKKKGRVSEESNELLFEKITLEEGEVAEEVLVVEKKQEPESPLLPIILVTLVNIAAGGVCITLLRKSSVQASFTLPTFAPLSDVEAAIAHLESVAAQTEIDINDPRLAEDKVSALPLRGVPAGTAATAAPAASEAAQAAPEAGSAQESTEAAPAADAAAQGAEAGEAAQAPEGEQEAKE